MHQTVKSIAGERIGGYLVVWGDSATRDLEGEYFTPTTELGLDWYDKRPMLYHHGLDGSMKAAVIGTIDTLRADEIGVWAEGQLDLRQRYVQAVLRLVERGVLSWSSGSLPHLVDVDGDGHIKRWPIIEGSLTPLPAEPRRTDVRTIKSAYEALGIDTAPLQIQPESDRREVKTRMNDKTLPIHNPQEATKTRIEVASEYDSLSALDMVHGYVLMRSGKSFQGTSERYANALTHKLTQGDGLLSGIKSPVSGDLSATVVTGYGDDWVPELWSREIWRKARQDNVILPLFRSIEMPSNPFELPIEGTDPDVFFVPETKDNDQLSFGNDSAIPGSKVGSGKVQLSAKKLALRVGFSAELVEDAIVPVLTIYREQAMRAIADSIDYVLLNGDTTSTDANINSGGDAMPGNHRALAFDGLRKSALQTADMAGASSSFNLSELRQTRFRQPPRYAARPNDLAWVVDSSTYSKMLGLNEFLTMEKAGVNATAQTGQIGFIDGAPVMVSAEMPMTNASGVIAGSGNTNGTALCVYRPGWFVGYRRRIAVSVDYLPYYDSYQLTATVRVAFARFDSQVASALYAV